MGLKENKHIRVIAIQIAVLLVVALAVFIFYPRVNVNINGNLVRFSSGNANVIVFSENPDFSNPRYLDLSERDSALLDFEPGKYYWKPYNGVIEGFSNEIIIDSEVGLGINRTGNDTDLVNVGNVKINVTKGDGGVMVGRIVLGPDESEPIEDGGEYVGKEVDNGVK